MHWYFHWAVVLKRHVPRYFPWALSSINTTQLPAYTIAPPDPDHTVQRHQPQDNFLLQRDTPVWNQDLEIHSQHHFVVWKKRLAPVDILLELSPFTSSEISTEVFLILNRVHFGDFMCTYIAFDISHSIGFSSWLLIQHLPHPLLS